MILVVCNLQEKWQIKCVVYLMPNFSDRKTYVWIHLTLVETTTNTKKKLSKEEKTEKRKKYMTKTNNLLNISK